MKESTPGQVLITVPAARWRVIWGAARGKLAQVSVSAAALEAAGLLADTVTGVGVIRSLDKLSEILTVEDDSPSARAYEWLGRALILTIVQFCHQLKPRQQQQLFDSVVLMLPDTVIDRHFFADPARLLIVVEIGKEVARAFPPGRRPLHSADPSCFGKWFHRHAARLYEAAPDRYQEILRATKDNPFVAAWEQEQEWERYSATVVQREWTRPLFGDQGDFVFGLNQVYVSLSAKVDAEGNSDESSPSHRLDLEAEMLDIPSIDNDFDVWLDTMWIEPSSRVRLVTGGPGSGKSSFMKALAQRTDTRRGPGGWHVVFIPLHRRDEFQFSGGLRSDVCAYLRRKGFGDQRDPCGDGESMPLLLLFDGLDELALPRGEGAMRDAQSLIDAVAALVGEASRGGQRRVRAVITGRSSVMQEVTAKHRPTAVGRKSLYHVQSYTEDQRITANERYAEALNIPLANLPKVLSDQNFEHLACEPLLHFFMAVSHRRLSNLQGLQRVTRAHVFDALFGNMFDRDTERLEGGGFKPGRAIFYGPSDDDVTAEDKFFRTMEAIALAASRVEGNPQARFEEETTRFRQAPSSEIEAALKEDELDDILQKLGQESRVAGLAATFFLRGTERDGVEFHHKSFGEYLYARRLGRWAYDAVEQIDSTKNAQAQARVTKDLFDDWLPLGSGHPMTVDVLDLLKEELVRVTSSPEVGRKWHEVLRPLVERALREGWQSVGNNIVQREAERRSVNAEEALFCTWRWLWQSALTKDQNEVQHWLFPIVEENRKVLASLLCRRVAAHGVHGLLDYSFSEMRSITNNLLLESLAYSDLRSIDLGDADLGGAYLLRANLDNAILRGADLFHAELESAKLENVNLHRATLEGASLRGANLRGANLRNACLRSARLHHATLAEVDMTDADLRAARLVSANLENAKLSGAILRNATLSKVNLRNADLRGADIQGANLRHSDLLGARFSKHPRDLGAFWPKTAPPLNIEHIIIEDCEDTDTDDGDFIILEDDNSEEE